MTLLDVQHVQKIYRSRLNTHSVEALKDIHFLIEKGEYVAIMGESGSGKTTLLNILALFDSPTKGSVFLNGVQTTTMKASDTAAFRRNELGFVFQNFSLLDTLSVKDNLILPLILSNTSVKQCDDAVKRIAPLLGIETLLKKFPYELSGGQQQRVAIGRAIITQPSLLLADEPTGALDSKSAAMILDLFDQVNQAGQTVLMVTHSTTAASRAKRVLFIKDGILYHQLYRGDKTDTQFFQQISDTLTSMSNRGELHV